MENYIPKLDFEVIKQKADEAAMKGALSEVNDFYNGYDSPFKKIIRTQLKTKEVNVFFDLPNVLGALNDKLISEIDTIANEALAKTFLPAAKEFLSGAPDEITITDIIREFAEVYYIKDVDYIDFTIERHHEYGWYSIEIGTEKKNYRMTLHETGRSEKEYKFLGLPHEEKRSGETMKLTLSEGAVLEMPFRRDILSDRFIAFIGRLVLAGTKVKIDTTHVPDDLLYED